MRLRVESVNFVRSLLLYIAAVRIMGYKYLLSFCKGWSRVLEVG